MHMKTATATSKVRFFGSRWRRIEESSAIERIKGEGIRDRLKGALIASLARRSKQHKASGLAEGELVQEPVA